MKRLLAIAVIFGSLVLGTASVASIPIRTAFWWVVGGGAAAAGVYAVSGVRRSPTTGATFQDFSDGSTRIVRDGKESWGH